jgi:hypothetical protein
MRSLEPETAAMQRPRKGFKTNEQVSAWIGWMDGSMDEPRRIDYHHQMQATIFLFQMAQTFFCFVIGSIGEGFIRYHAPFV